MSPRSVHTRRMLLVLVPLALVATLLSTGTLSGQGDGDDVSAIVVESEFLLPSASVAVLGDGLVAAPSIAPLSERRCVSSSNGPVEQAAKAALGTVIAVHNEACVGATLSSIGQQQVPELATDTPVVVVGGIGLEFDWASLANSCLNERTRSAAGCQSEATIARATAANSFFSWRSLLQQIHRQAPDATIVLLAPPTPVTATPLPLGSNCCSPAVDGRAQVRAVFDTAGSLRRAVVESTVGLPLIIVDPNEVFAGHRLDDIDPWLTNDVAAFGSPTADGADALADLLEAVMPVGTQPEALPATSAEIVLVLGTTLADNIAHDSISEASSAWVQRFVDSNVQPSVAVVPIATSDVIIAPATTTTTTTTTTVAPEGGPVAEDSAAIEIPLDEAIDAVDNPNPAPVVDDVPNGRALQDAPVPAIASFATTAVELAEALDTLETSRGVTSVADLVTSLTESASLLTPDVDSEIVIRSRNLDLVNASFDDLSTLISAVNNIDSAITFIAIGGDQLDALELLLGDTTTVLIRSDDDDLSNVLPAPKPPLALREVYAADVDGFLARPVHVTADITTSRPESAEVRWLASGNIVAAGQQTTLPTDLLGLGQHEIIVVVTTQDEQLSTTMTVHVSADGDGRADDVCDTAFDPFPTDIDGDGLPAACDDDDDGDTLPDTIDPCPNTATDNLRDLDLDGLPDRCDADVLNGPNGDVDGDGFADSIDNCPNTSQENQFDADHDGVGNACEGTLSTPCTITGTEGNDVLTGTEGDDVICGLGGNDTITALGGDDIIFAGPGEDVVYAGFGDDRIYGGSGADDLNGNGGDDVILGEAADDLLSGGFGADILAGGRGIDAADGGPGPDVLFGGRGNDILRGNDGPDTITGERGNDEIFGEDGNDLLTGGLGQDSVRAGRGDDTLIGIDANDFARGGTGIDLIDAAPIRVT